MQNWIFSVRYFEYKEDPPIQRLEVIGRSCDSLPPLQRRAVVGPACASTVETALHLANVPEQTRAEIRSCPVVRAFIEGGSGPALMEYYVRSETRNDRSSSWIVCIGPVHAVLDR